MTDASDSDSNSETDVEDGEATCERCGRVPVMDEPGMGLKLGFCPVCYSWKHERGEVP